MSERFWTLFFELYEALPRQGPGNRACAERALSLCRLPASPRVLDLGCGVGAQTLYLAELTDGPILAIDSHPPSVERLRATLVSRGLTHRVEALVGDMTESPVEKGSIDLIWSEGALYNLGLERALNLCYELLRPGAYLVFTDAVWLVPDPPAEVRRTFDLDYPTMGTIADDLALVEKCGFELLGHFTLPDEAWWTDFYTPMEQRIEVMRAQYADDDEALAILDQLAEEPALHRVHGGDYGYELFVARRPHADPDDRPEMDPATTSSRA